MAVRAGDEELAQFGFNRLIESAGKSLVGEFVTIVQHPRGEKKQVALRENRIVDNLDRFVHYSADTEPGSSGSPVFNDQWEVIALHHASVRAPEHTEFGGVLNEGIRVSAILGAVKASPLSAEQRTLADMILHPPTQERKPCPASGVPTVPGSPISIKIPLTLDLTLPPGAAAQLRFEQPPPEGRRSRRSRRSRRVPSRSTRTTAPAAATTRRSWLSRCRCRRRKPAPIWRHRRCRITISAS